MRYKKVNPLEEKEIVPKRSWKRIVTLLLSSIAVVGVYIAGCSLRIKAVVYIYYAALLVLGVAFLILNRGVSNTLPTPDMLPDAWSAAEKDAFIEKEKIRKHRARLLLYGIIPLLMTFAFDLIYMAFWQKG